MIDDSRLKDVLSKYKDDFVSARWPVEKYKWEAVKTFQDHWDVNADDFADMLTRSLSQTSNLLTSAKNFPSGMITGFAKSAPEEVRSMFVALFDESRDVVGRITEFKNQSAILLKKYGNGAAQHYQYENAITTYLWLRYPDKYYIYKYGEVKTVADELHSDYPFKKGAYTENLRNFYTLYDEICARIKADQELTNLLQTQLNDACYSDPEYRTLTTDVGFYISRVYSQRTSEPETEWTPADYSPEITTDTWTHLLHNPDVFHDSSLEIMKRMKDYGGEATCKQLSMKYGQTNNFYNSGSSRLAKRVQNATGCSVYIDDEGNTKWWPILYLGRDTRKKEEGSFIWKLRDELSAALDRVDLSDTKLYASAAGEAACRYWWLTANPKIWSFSKISVGEVQSYTLYNETGHKRRVFQNFLDVRAGDILIGYESNPVKKIVAICRITAEQDGEKIQFEKTESIASPIDYATLKSIPELSQMEFFTNRNGSLFQVTKDEYDCIMDLIRDEKPTSATIKAPKYDKEDFLEEVFMSEQQYDMLVNVLKYKKNIILQGAPGVGKTFAARRLAYSMIGEQDDRRIEFVQFHQNYSYEDFIMGYKPSGDGFELQNGIFYRFCQKAADSPDKDFFFIIDEINRGNMSKIFGELLLLIESDYRGTATTLAYNGVSFSVPKNLYMIGMMNTADRSLAMIDYALRRRFSFFDIEPGFDSERFIQYQNELNNETFNRLIDTVKALNQKISEDKSLGKGFCIGHSYFSNWEECTEERMRAVVDYDIIPMLSEYWFDDDKTLQEWSNHLHGVFQ